MELAQLYFKWLCDIVKNSNKKKLLNSLFITEFTYTFGFDGNREADGIGLRYRFGRENGYPDYIISDQLDMAPCSVLEMMIALALRCEEGILDNKPDRFFWDMVKSLGLYSMTDNAFNKEKVNTTIEKLLNHEYLPTGVGGLFTMKHPPRDMRGAEIWYQAMWYIDEKYNDTQ